MNVKERFSKLFKAICWTVLITFCSDILIVDIFRIRQAEAQEIFMPSPGTLMALSPQFSLPTLKAIAIDPLDPFKLSFVVDAADQKQLDQDQIKDLTTYFLGFLTLPEEDLWVNLSPYEQNRIVMPDVEQTSVGKDMLVQDYILKQLAASMTYPENETGKVFWQKVRDRARKEYGVEELPINTFTKVWVVPDRAVVYEQDGAAFISESRLKVLLEKDYLSIAQNKNKVKVGAESNDKVNGISSEIAREVIVPELEKEVNQGKHFAPLRQMYHSLILAIWFKKTLQKNLINQIYSDQKKISGITLDQKNIKEKIYEQYLVALKKGVYNVIREEDEQLQHEAVPRKYFSGGFSFGDSHRWFSSSPINSISLTTRDFLSRLGKKLSSFTVMLNPIGLTKSSLIGLALAGGLLATPNGLLNQDPGLIDQAGSGPSATAQQAVDRVGPTAQGLVGTATPAEQAHQIARLGDRLDETDQNDIAKLKQQLTPEDVSQLNSKTNFLTGQKYQVDSNYFKNHWNAVFVGQHLNWAKQTLIIAFQEKHHLQPDGQLGPQTRAALNKISVDKDQPLQLQEKARAPAKVTSQDDGNLVVDDRNYLRAVYPISADDSARATRVNGDLQSLKSELTAQANVLPPAAENASLVTVAQQDEPKPFIFTRQTAVIPIEQSLVIQNNGIVQDLNVDKREYRRGEVVCKIVNPDLEREKQDLRAQIRIAENKLQELESLLKDRAATELEVRRVRAQVSALKMRDAALDQRMATEVVRAPYALSIKDWKISNGMPVVQGGVLLDYYGREQYRVVLELPTTISDFSQISVKVDGKPVRVGQVTWDMAPQEDHARVSLNIISTAAVYMGQKIDVELTVSANQQKKSLLQNLNIKAQTLSKVYRVQERVVNMPSPGPVRFLVHEGDKVKKGQVLAVVLGSPYVAEYEETMSQISQLEEQIQQALPGTDGVSYVHREQLDQLRSQLAAAQAKKMDLRKKITRLAIRAVEDGVIIKSQETHAGQFEMNAEILRLRTAQVVIGDLTDPQKMVLLPKSLTINPQDPVVVQTPSGMRIVGKIVAVNATPYLPDQQMNDVQSVVINVNDRLSQLAKDLPVTIYIPDSTEKSKLKEVLKKSEREEKEQFKNEAVYTRLTNDIIAGAPFYRVSAQTTTVDIPIRVSQQDTVNAQRFTISDVEGRIAGNTRLIGGEVIEYIKAKTAEKLPDSTRITLQGGVWMADGKLVVGGGVQGVFNNLFSAGLSSGNAIGAALPVIFQFAGNVVDALSGKKVLEKDLAIHMTQLAYHQMEIVVYARARETADLLIELGAVEQNLNTQNGLLNDLKTAKRVLERRLAGGFSVADDLNRQQEKIDQLQGKIRALETQRQTLTVSLNSLLGQSTRNLHPGIHAEINWDQSIDFSTDEEREFLVALRDVNPRISQARTALSATQLAAGYQASEKLPSVNLTGLFIDDGHGLNPIYDFIPGTSMRSSRMNQGANGVVRMEIPLFDSGAQTRGEIKSLEILQAEQHLQKQKAEVRTLAVKVVEQIRDLKIEIDQAQRTFDNAVQVLKLKEKRPDLYTADKVVEERIKIAEAKLTLTDLKAKQFKLAGQLRELGLRSDKLTPTNPTGSNSRGIENSADASFNAGGLVKADANFMASRVEKFSWSDSGVTQGQPVETTAGGFISAGFVTYPANTSVANTWALMSGTTTGIRMAIDALKHILIHDANMITRQDALGHLFTEHQNNKKLNQALTEIVLQTPYLDVVQEILKYSVERKDHDLRFIIQIIDQAQANGKNAVADLAFQAMVDVLTDDQNIWENFSESLLINTGKGISLETSRNVMLTFLAREPDDSIAKAKLLMSDYWSLDELAQIYHGLMALVQSNQPIDKNKVRNLARLIQDTISKRNVINNIPDVFNAGVYKNYPEMLFLIEDIYARMRISAIAKTNERFVKTTSSPWPNFRNDLPVKLSERAEQATTEILAANAQSGTNLKIKLGQLDGRTRIDAPLSAFASFDVAGQKRYVQNVKSVAILARLLYTDTPIRGVILDQLIATREGRLAVLQILTANASQTLVDDILARDWVDVLKADIALINNSAELDIYRRALIRIYEQSHEEWALNLRLATYSYAELHTATDPRGADAVKAHIDRVATQMALDLIHVKDEYTPFTWSGYTLHTPAEFTLLKNLEQILKHADDPREIRKFLDAQDARHDQSIQDLLDEIKSSRDMIVQDIVSNNQDIPKVPSLIKKFFMILGLAVLGVFIKSFRGKVLVKKGTIPAMISRLRAQLVPNGNHDSKNGKNIKLTKFLEPAKVNEQDELVISIPNGLNGGYGEPLKAWELILDNWSQNSLSVEPQAMLADMSTILNYGFEIIRQLPFTPDLMRQEVPGEAKNELYQKVLSYYNLLAVDTLHILTLRQADLVTMTEIEKKRLANDVEVLLETVEYVATFLEVLENRSIIDKVMSYKYNDQHWAERSLLYPFIRVVLLYRYLLNQSKTNLKSKIPELLSKGNHVMPDFYDEVLAIEQQSQLRLTEAIETAQSLSNQGTEVTRLQNKNRSFWSRARAILGFLLPIAMSLLLWALGYASLGVGFSLLGAIGFTITLGIYWIPHMEIMRLNQLKLLKTLTEKLEQRMDQSLGFQEGTLRMGRSKDIDDKIVQLALQEGLEERNRELDLKSTPRIDMILVVAEKPPAGTVDRRDWLDGYVQKGRKRIFREDIPVEVYKQKDGDLVGSGNVYLDAIRYAREKLNNDQYRAQYPHAKPWEQSRVLVVFHGASEAQNSYDLLDLAILNGYRAAGYIDRDQNHAPGARHIMVYSRDAYWGPILTNPAADISIVSARVDQSALSELGFINTKYPKNGDPKVLGIYEKLDVAHLADQQRSSQMAMLRENGFDLNNSDFNQYPAVAGIFSLGPSAVELYTKLAVEEEFHEMRKQLPQVHMVAELIIPFLLARVNRGKFAQVRVGWDDIHRTWSGALSAEDREIKEEALRRNFLDWYNMIARNSSHLRIETGLAHPGAAKYIHVTNIEERQDVTGILRGNPNFQAVKRYVSHSPTPVETPISSSAAVQKPSETPGGLDLTNTKKQIEFKKQTNPVMIIPQGGVPVPGDLNDFKGFEFQILQFQPLPNPAEFFIGHVSRRSRISLAQR